mmetsp:Transcript_2092/g.3160  ORF Transcript_2092/g.3160 Transcript_2092/m.3160 type:complete len:91 (-) Transcript_2092:13-285(-)
MIKALREVNGKYVGNRPIRLKKSNWRERNIDSEQNKAAKDFVYAVEQRSKSLAKFKKIKVKQDVSKQKEKHRARVEAEAESNRMGTFAKR